MVDLFDAAPKLMMSSTPRWEDKSVWFNKVNEDYGSFTAIPEAQRKVDELIKGKKTEMEKIAVLTHWVADNIRYSGISMGKGEGFTLHNLKMNYTDRCGVCKDIAGTLANLAPEVDAWYCAPLEGPRGATAEQLVEHLRGGTVYSSVAQAWHAAMADAKVEDTVLVCGSFHTVAQVMEEIDAGRIGGE